MVTPVAQTHSRRAVRRHVLGGSLRILLAEGLILPTGLVTAALAAFVEMLNGGPSRVATLYDGLRSLEIVAAAEESARAALSPALS